MPITDKRRAYNREYANRTHRVSVTLTHEEYRTLKAQAKTVGQRPTSLAKERITTTTEKPPPLPAAIQAELQEIRFLLRNTANNINQIAHHSNTIRHLVDENGLLLEIRKMEEAIFAWVQTKHHP